MFDRRSLHKIKCRVGSETRYSYKCLVTLCNLHSNTRSPARPARFLGAGRAPEEPGQAARAGAPGHARVRQGGGAGAARRVRLEAQVGDALRGAAEAAR